MSAGVRAYGADLQPIGRRCGFSAAGFIARLPMAMSGIGIVLLVSLTTGSFGRAGLITGVGTAVGGGRPHRCGDGPSTGWARPAVLIVAAVDQRGQAVGADHLGARDWPLAVSLIAAVGVGVGYSSAGSAVRARWSARLAGSAAAEHRVRVRGDARRGRLHHRPGPGHLLVDHDPSRLRHRRQRACLGLIGALRPGRPAPDPTAGHVPPSGRRSRRDRLPVACCCPSGWPRRWLPG